MLRKAIIVAAVWVLASAGAAAASIYNYETYWTNELDDTYYQYVPDKRIVGGNDACVAVPVIGSNSQYVHVDNTLWYKEFDADGNVLQMYYVYSLMVGEYYSRIYGFDMAGDTPWFSYEWWLDYAKTRMPAYYSAINIGRTYMVTGKSTNYFQSLAAVQGTDYYYCWRKYAGAYRLCKMKGANVVSYFTPPGNVWDVVTDSAGTVYLADGNEVLKYRDDGTLLAEWAAPQPIMDLSLDSQSRVLALCEDKYTYVYDAGGAFLGSFTGPYAVDIYSAAVGPGDKYFVLGYKTAYLTWDTIYMYRFAPSMTNIRPASLGRIKAMFQ